MYNQNAKAQHTNASDSISSCNEFYFGFDHLEEKCFQVSEDVRNP